MPQAPTRTPQQPLPPRSRARQEGKSRPLLKLFIWIIVIVIVGALGAAAWYLNGIYQHVDDAIDSMGTQEKVEPQQSAKVKPLTILLLGKDTRKETGSLNTDVIMVASLNPAKDSATIVSIPRDTMVKLNGYRTNKANAYYANFYVEDKATAMKETKLLFGKYLDVPIDYTAIINFQGFVDVVDHLGPLSIEVDQNMCYRDNFDGTNIQLKQGLQMLNGDKTLDFVRYRHSNCNPKTPESSDIERNQRQKDVLNQLIDKMKSVNVLPKIGPMITSVGRNVETDIPSDQIKQLIQTYIGIDRDKINYIHLQGTWQSPYIVLTAEELADAKLALKKQLQ
jgi:polyisoprenyl-teichoic acid--peptidoglycan teichoic acid transferase